MESSRRTAAIWCGSAAADRRRTGVSIKINARLPDLFSVTWKTLPGKTVWIQGTSSRPDRLPRLSTQNWSRDRYSQARALERARAPFLFFFPPLLCFIFSSGSHSHRRVFARPPLPHLPTRPLHTGLWNLILMEMKSRLFGCPMTCCFGSPAESFLPGFPHRMTPSARHRWGVLLLT